MTRIVDGDTVYVVVDGVEESVRLIGINTPEKSECFAAEASERLSDLIEGKHVRLETDTSDRDQFDRLLRYIFIDDVFVNETLVANGFALARRYEPDTRMADVLDRAQSQARDSSLGLWAGDACGVATESELTIGQIRFDADGNDNDNLNDEWVEIVNGSIAELDLTGWTVKDESASHRYSFPSGFTLPAGAVVRLHTGCGRDTASLLYWCNQGSAVWNNSGDTVFVLDPAGNIVDSYSY